MKVKYNNKTRRIEYSLTKLDPNNWRSSYRKLMDDSEELADAISDAKLYTIKEPKWELVSSPVAEIHYFIYNGIVNNEDWVDVFAIKNTKVRKELLNLARKALAEIDVCINKLLVDPDPKDASHYVRDPKMKDRRYYKIDNDNRFVFQPKLPYRVEVLSLMFHHNDKPTNYLIKRLFSMYDSYDNSNFKSRLLQKRIDKLSIEYKRKSRNK